MVDIKARLSQAVVFAERQQFEELERAARDLLQISPDEAEAHNLLGVALARTNRSDLAIDSFRSAHQLRPSHYGYARNLVRLLGNQKRYDDMKEIGRRYEAAGHPKADELSKFIARLCGDVAVNARDVFDEIYKSNAWSSGSGLGSTEQTTRTYRTFLVDFLRANRIRSVVDLGCGDWQFAVLIDWTGIRYIGLDVSATALEMATRVAPDNCEFRLFDAFADTLPDADLLIAKDVLQHWPSAEIARFLPQLDRFRFALITNGYAASSNLNGDIDLGNFRPLDLTAAPFHSPGANVLSFQADDFKMTLLRQGRV